MKRIIASCGDCKGDLVQAASTSTTIAESAKSSLRIIAIRRAITANKTPEHSTEERK